MNETSPAALYVVTTPIGNLADLTPRAREVLASVAVVYAEDTRRTGKLLAEIDAEPRLRSLHEHNEARRAKELVARLREGTTCALVTDAGVPGISDPGRRAVEAATEAGARIVPIPGASALTAALSVAGLPADRFLFLGFPPRTGAERATWLDRCAETDVTTVAFESPRRVAELLETWRDRGLGHRRCALCRELTKLHEEVRRGTVSELATALEGVELRGEVTLVLEGREAEPSADLESARRRARELVRAGRSTREIAERLQEEGGVSRNDAYRMGLEAAEAVEAGEEAGEQAGEEAGEQAGEQAGEEAGC